MGGMKVENVTSRVVMLGDNHFQSAKITLAAGATLVAGAVLKRAASELDYEFEAATSADNYAAVNPFELKNETAADKPFGFRALLDGRVRADMLRVGTAAVTHADIDKLRNIGILPVKVTDLSQTDNQ
jgi:hypothetical protein